MKSIIARLAQNPLAMPGRWAFIASREWLLRSLLYLLFFAISLAVFIYIRFPSDKLLPVIGPILQDAPARLEPKKASLAFPPGLRLTSVAVSQKRRPNLPLFTIDRITVRPSLLSLLIGGKRANFQSEVLGGSLEGMAGLSGGGDSDMDLLLEFAQLDPGKGEWWDKFPWFKAEGSINGHGRLSVKKGDPLTGEGLFYVDISGGKITLGKSLSPAGAAVVITKGELELKMAKGMITLEKGAFSGPDINVQLTGGAGAAPNIMDFRLNVTASISISSGLKEKLGMAAAFLPQANHEGKHIIRLGGTLANPLVK